MIQTSYLTNLCIIRFYIFSSYCGGLWLGALYCMVQMSDCLGNTDDKTYYSDLLEKAKSAFESILWNGSYYNFDESNYEAKSIMADQLCGHWYLCCCGVRNYPVRLLWRI